MSKIVLIGANHAGTAAANTILDVYPGHDVTIIDRNSNISYLGCGTAPVSYTHLLCRQPVLGLSSDGWFRRAQGASDKLSYRW